MVSPTGEEVGDVGRPDDWDSVAPEISRDLLLAQLANGRR